MQPNEPQQDDTVRQRILAGGRYVHPQNSLRQSEHVTIDMLAAPATPLEQSPVSYYTQPTAATSVPKQPVTKKNLFSSLVKASVEVERVTRQSVQSVKHSFEPPHISAMRTRRQKLLVRGFYALGALSFVFAVVLGARQLTESNKPRGASSVLGAETDANDATRSSELPAENKPTTEDINTYLVAPQYPRYIRIPSINVDARIRRLGIDRNGAIATPNNINDAGWYDASVKPGEKEGASIIEGHVAGKTQHGVFWDVSKLTIGAIIEIEKGNGEVISYKVTRTEKVAKEQLNMSSYLSSEIPGKHDLKLITTPSKSTILSGASDMRFVVFAQQM